MWSHSFYPVHTVNDYNHLKFLKAKLSVKIKNYHSPRKDPKFSQFKTENIRKQAVYNSLNILEYYN